MFAVLPATSTYQLNSYGFGSGGGTSSTSTYSLEGQTGETGSGNSGTSTYKIVSGDIATEQANVPKLSSFDNNGGLYYNKLHFTIDTQNNPSDATYALSISTDNFTSDIRYVQADMTVGTTLSPANFLTYSAWGGASGNVIIGLTPGTTYQLRAAASRGTYTQSAFGPSASVATANPSITFNLTTSTQNNPPFVVSFSSFSPDTIQNSQQTINIGLTTNAANGGNVYITSKYGALKSAQTGKTITSVSADLAAILEGYGAQAGTATQSSGGPLTAVTPFTASGTTVAQVSTATQSLYTTAAPVSGASATVTLKAKTTSTTVAASDYTDILTFTAAGNF